MGARIVILDPTAPPGSTESSATFDLGRPLNGVRVGLRLDRSWRSYEVVLDVWQRLLKADGAIPEVLVVGERVGEEGERTRNDLDEWSRLVDIGVVGLGN
ncbi:MAG TPA: hypothetical protein VGQ20_07545 [Acidimicrobiales bacterium]|jgi:hypothetical protein|nr:hypothetical protein [Acidimicrobiales bacterium]